MNLTPWIDQLVELSDEEIRRKIEQIPAPIDDLNCFSGDQAEIKLNAHYSNMLIVTDEVLRIVSKLYRVMRAALNERYPSEHQHFITVQEQTFTEPTIAPICFTGLAGLGKTAILNALSKILLYQDALFRPAAGVEVRWMAYVHVKVHEQSSASEVIRKICAQLQDEKWNGGTLEHLRADGYRRGLAAIAIDELQHLTLSAVANTRLAGLLLALRQTHIPLIYGCNYSLVWRLCKRRPEDRDRVLSNIYHLNPESPMSEDWRRVVEQYINAAPGVFRLSAIEHAEVLGVHTACLGRSLRDLLTCSYARVRESGRKTVTIDDVRAAYKSLSYGNARSTVEELARQSALRIYRDPDLSLPEHLRERVEEERIEEQMRRARQKQTAREVAELSLTSIEREGMKRALAGEQNAPVKNASRRGKKDLPTEADFLKGLEHVRNIKTRH